MVIVLFHRLNKITVVYLFYFNGNDSKNGNYSFSHLMVTLNGNYSMNTI